MCIYIHNTETFTESTKADKLFLSRRHPLLKPRPLNWIISSNQQYRWRSTNRWESLEEGKPRSLARKKHLLPLQSHLSANKPPPSNLCCSLLLWINVLEHLYTSFNGFKPFRQFWYHRNSLFKVWLRFLSFLCFFKRIFDFEFKEAGQDSAHDRGTAATRWHLQCRT